MSYIWFIYLNWGIRHAKLGRMREKWQGKGWYGRVEQFYCDYIYSLKMIKRTRTRDPSLPMRFQLPVAYLKNSPTPPKTSQTSQQSQLYAISALHIRPNTKHFSSPNHNDSSLLLRQSSIEQIKSKLKEYLRRTQQHSLLNYQNELLPTFTAKNTNEHFRTTLFRNNLKRKTNIRMIDNSMTDRYESPEFNVSEAFINPRNMQRFEPAASFFQPKRDYFIHHQHKKEKSQLPKSKPNFTVFPLTKRESSFRERERSGLGLQPWRRWGRESEEEGELNPHQDP